MCVGLTIVWIGCAIGISRRDSYRALSVDQIIHKKHHIKVGAKRGHKWRKQKMNNEKKNQSQNANDEMQKKERAANTRISRTHIYRKSR